MSRSDKRTSKNKDAKQANQSLPEAELDKVSGGKATLSDITITKQYDKSSPNLG